MSYFLILYVPLEISLVKKLLTKKAIPLSKKPKVQKKSKTASPAKEDLSVIEDTDDHKVKFSVGSFHIFL